MSETKLIIIVMFCLFLIGFMVVLIEKHKDEPRMYIYSIIYKILGVIVIMMAGVHVFEMFN